MYPLEKCEKIELSQGAIYLGPSDENQSVGYLELKPHTSLNLHNRPAVEKLTQVKNRSQLINYQQEQGEIITLKPGESYVIEPAGTWHIHANPYDTTSLTYWDFDGDIVEIIEAIRK